MAKPLTIQKATGSHYTSSELSSYMAKKLFQYADHKEEKQIILDPACGDGELLKAIYAETANEHVEIVGMDTHLAAVEKASERLNAMNHDHIHLFHQDYLDLFDDHSAFDLFSEVKSQEDFWKADHEQDGLKKVDMILANPPYVRTQVLGADQAQALGKKFHLKGRVDLYHVFLVAMTRHLKENGLICVITSNRYLTTAGGKDIRDFLDSNYDILEVIDLGDTKLFESAVLPAIFIGRKKAQQSAKKNDTVQFIRLYENTSLETSALPASSVYDILDRNQSGLFEYGNKTYEMTAGYLKIPDDPKELWIMASAEDLEWSQQVKARAKYFFHDVFHVRVGIKTTADKVFIRKNWDTLDLAIQPEQEVLRSLVSSDTVGKWHLSSEVERLKVLYTHEMRDGKRQVIDVNQYPRAKAYLESHRDVLAARKYVIEAKRQWYEIWVPQNPEAWAAPKIVFPDISPEPRFAIDTNGYLVDGNCYWLSAKHTEDNELLYLAVAIANSKFMTRFHEIEFQNKLYSGRKRYLTQYVKNYVLPDPNLASSQRLIQLGKALSEPDVSKAEILAYEQEIEHQVQHAFGF